MEEGVVVGRGNVADSTYKARVVAPAPSTWPARFLVDDGADPITLLGEIPRRHAVEAKFEVAAFLGLQRGSLLVDPYDGGFDLSLLA